MSDNATNLKGLLYSLKELEAAEKRAASDFHNNKAVPKDYLKNKNERKRNK
jgi:hypothetical protein